MNTTDRALRSVLGAGLVGVAIGVPAMADYPMMALLTGIFGGANVFSGIFGFCFAYRLAGVSTLATSRVAAPSDAPSIERSVGSQRPPISQARLAIMLASAGLIVIAVFAWGIQNGVNSYRDRLEAEAYLASIESSPSTIVTFLRGSSRIELEADGSGWSMKRDPEGGDDVMIALLRGRELFAGAAGVVRAAGDTYAWCVAEVEGGDLAVYYRRAEMASPTGFVSFRVPLIVASAVILWVMVWSGIWIGGVLKRSYRQNWQLAEQATELRSARDAAQSAARAKTLFLAKMSHEIRTPMTGVLGLSELLLEQRLSDSAREQVQQIRSSAFSLVSIINEILDFSRFEAGQVSLQPAAVQLRSAIEAGLVGVRFQAEAADLLLKLEVASSLPEWVELDAIKFGQVLQNLVGNAVKFTERGVIRVIAEDVGGPGGELSLQLKVMDSGKGIPACEQTSIFEDYVQSEPSSAEGLGLGLPIASQIVKAMGGTIAVESEVGVGSTFTVLLPLHVIDAPVPEEDEQSFVGLGGQPSVLVAEDNDLNRSLIVRILEKLEIEPVVACDGVEAVEAFREQRFDLILMDYRMPNMNGIDATARIRQLEAEGSVDHAVHIVALTGNASQADWMACRDAGMDEMVAKPFTLEQLRSVVQKALAKRVEGAPPQG